LRSRANWMKATGTDERASWSALEARALAIAIFYAIGTAIGVAAGPLLFGFLIGSGAIVAVAGGYAVAAILMLIAAAAEFKFGINAERRSLESIAEPLSSVS
jgi:MFS family permease